MKNFLEKRWWGGVGVIVTLILGVPALIQLIGKAQVSWLAVTITLSIVLAIVIILLTIWNMKLQGKYKDVNTRVQNIRELLKQQHGHEQEDKKNTMILLPDPNYIWKLNIDNTLLTQLCGQAHGLALDKFSDAKLHDMSIQVNPYNDNDRVTVYFEFYSKWADRRIAFYFNERGNMEELRSYPAEIEADRLVFNEMPWLRDPDWPDFLRKSCEKVDPLSHDLFTSYHLSTQVQFPPLYELPWTILFEDGVTGKTYRLEWDGKGEPITEEDVKKMIRKDIKSWLKKYKQSNE